MCSQSAISRGLMTSVCEDVRGCARSSVEYFRCEVSELINQSLTVDLVKDAACIVVPAAQA